jgi:hypothetical protein
MNRKKVISHLIEFFVVGVVFGVTEDILAIKLATDAEITWHVLKVAVIVAIPFAVLSELLVDLKFFRRSLKRFLKKK